jgi:hypothetical protein
MITTVLVYSDEMAEAVKLAEESLFKGGSEYNECDLNTLARALLSFKPLIEVLKKEISPEKVDLFYTSRLTGKTTCLRLVLR